MIFILFLMVLFILIGLVNFDNNMFISEWFMVLYMMLVRIKLDVFISKLVIIRIVFVIVRFVV